MNIFIICPAMQLTFPVEEIFMFTLRHCGIVTGNNELM
jgi:hypothetical protein